KRISRFDLDSFSDWSLFFFMFSNRKHVFGMPCFLTKLSSYDYYLQCLKYKKEEDLNYIDAVYEIALQCIELKEFEEAKEWISKGVDVAKRDEKYKSMLYILLVLKHKYFETKDVYKKFLEVEAIPFYRSEENKKELKMVYLELAAYHEELLEFRESNNYYKLAINLLEEKGGK
ncbi:hypothetical protein ACQVTQ_30490, partial [Bacillus mycoides]